MLNKPQQEMKSSLSFEKTKADHVTVFIINYLGSIKFLITYIIFLGAWIVVNSEKISFLKFFDPFPYPMLEMIVSIFAIVLSITVLVNQNRQDKIESIKQQIEFEVNVRAEIEITKVLTMVHEIYNEMGLGGKKEDGEIKEMKRQLDLDKMHHSLDEK